MSRQLTEKELRLEARRTHKRPHLSVKQEKRAFRLRQDAETYERGRLHRALAERRQQDATQPVPEYDGLY